MESANKLAATECLRKAEKKLIEGDYNESLRLAKKSSRLCSSQEAEELMEKIQSKMTSGSGGGVPTTEGEDVRQRRQEDQANSSRSDHPPSDACAPAYTPQQQQSVDRVIRCTTFYEVLSVEKEDGVDVVKKSYRRLALQLHPDKNKAPRAAEAFKRVSKAYDTLSDPEKKRMYDQFGEQGLEGAQQGGFHRHYHADDFDADKLFRDFFGFDPFGPGTSFNTTTFYFDDNSGQNIFFQSGPRRRGVHNQHFRNSVRVENRRDSTLMLSYLMFLVPVFLLFVLPVLVEVFSPPEFSLQPSPPYTVKRELQVGDAKLPYYVKTDVNNSPESYRRMEKNVLLSYADRYLQLCHNQRIQKAKAQRMARTAAEVKKANEQKTEDCDLYMQLLNAKI